MRIQNIEFRLGGFKKPLIWQCPSTVSCTVPSSKSPNCRWIHQRCAPAEWNLSEIFRFSHRFWREILVKFSVAHPNPGKRSTENFTKISRQISRHLWQRKTEKNFTSALLQGSCSEDSQLRTQLRKQTLFSGECLCPSTVRRGFEYGWGGCPSTGLLLTQFKDQNGNHGQNSTRTNGKHGPNSTRTQSYLRVVFL